MLCPLKDTGATRITGWYGNKLVVPGARYYIREHSTIYLREYRVSSATRASSVCYVLVSGINMNTLSRTTYL